MTARLEIRALQAVPTLQAVPRALPTPCAARAKAARIATSVVAAARPEKPARHDSYAHDTDAAARCTAERPNSVTTNSRRVPGLVLHLDVPAHRAASPRRILLGRTPKPLGPLYNPLCAATALPPAPQRAVTAMLPWALGPPRANPHDRPATSARGPPGADHATSTTVRTLLPFP